MKTPRNEEIDTLCAEVCGIRLLAPPYFCKNRESMDKLLLKVLEADRDLTFNAHMNAFAIAEASDYHEHVNAICASFWTLLASPRLVATAALLALKKWPDDWALPAQSWPREYKNL